MKVTQWWLSSDRSSLLKLQMNDWSKSSQLIHLVSTKHVFIRPGSSTFKYLKVDSTFGTNPLVVFYRVNEIKCSSRIWKYGPILCILCYCVYLIVLFYIVLQWNVMSEVIEETFLLLYVCDDCYMKLIINKAETEHVFIWLLIVRLLCGHWD